MIRDIFNISYGVFKQTLEHNLKCYHILQGDNSYIVYSSCEEGIFESNIIIESEILDFQNNYLSDSVAVSSSNDVFVLSKLDQSIPLLSKRTPNGLPKFVNEPRQGNETIYATHNFCDRTSWFGDSIRTTEVLSGSGTIFSSSYINWIDMEHGKILDEDGLKEDVEHGYQIVVVASGSTLEMREPYEETGGDYVVNYQSGSITIVNGQNYTSGEVTASFSYENGSTFYIKPYPFKKLDIEEVEAQFTKDVIIKDTIVFEIFGYVQVFAPQYWQENGGPFPTNYKVPLVAQKYKTIAQLTDEALGSYPVIPAIGGSSGRGFTKEMYGFPFRYGTVRTLYDNYGLEIRVYNKNHRPQEGERVTATFYCVSSNED